MNRFIVAILIFTTLLFGNNTIEQNDIYVIEDKDINGKTIIIEESSYKILKFSKRIIDIRLGKSDELSVVFLDNKTSPFSEIKVFAKKVGKVNALITFSDKTISQINFNIIPDITVIKFLIKKIDKTIDITQVDNNIILRGIVTNNKIKNKVLTLLKDALPESKIIDLMKVEEPDKMIRLKLYVVEVNNKEGETIKNNWTYDSGLNNGQTTLNMSTDMLSAVTLSGGLTVAANRLGSVFNAGLTLNYLKSNGVAKILDETTLVTLENQESKFLAGGNLLIETTTTSAEGQPISEVEEFPYGLNLKINVNNIVNDKYITLEIDTKSSTLDMANGVGNLPATKEKSIKTKVVVANKSTVVLGGLINNTNSNEFEKVPLLGDIPILGLLFQSKAFQEGNSELIFFITPTIIDVQNNDQNDEYNNLKQGIVGKKKEKENINVSNKKEIKQSNTELHNQRVKEMFGI